MSEQDGTYDDYMVMAEIAAGLAEGFRAPEARSRLPPGHGQLASANGRRRRVGRRRR